MQDGEARAASGGKVWGVVAGCAIAFGVLLLIGVAFGVYGLYWFFSPGRQMPTSLVVGPASVGVVRLERGDTDPGIQALAEEAMAAMQRAQVAAGEGTVPPWVQRLREWQLAQSRNNLGMWVPREVTLSLEPGAEEGEARAVAAINFHGLVRPVGALVGRLLKKERGTRVVPHGDHEVLVVSDRAALCFAEGTLLFGSDAGSLVAVLDRWGRGAAAAPPLPAAVRDLAGRFDVYGALERPEEARAFLGLFTSSLRQPLDPERGRPWIDGLERVRFALDVRSSDEVQALAELVYESPESARKARDGLVEMMSDLRQRAVDNGLTLKGGPARTEGALVKVDLELLGIRAGLRRWSAEVVRPRRR
jgi:hypothetical protein